LALFLPAAGNCQSLGFADADNASEAVGMMKTSMHAAEVMRHECVSRFPNFQKEIDDNLRKWKTVEANTLRKTEIHWAAMVRKKPDLSDTLAYAEVAVKRNLETVSGMPGQASAQVVSQYCRQHFANLASGIWRARTPRAYQYMDRLP